MTQAKVYNIFTSEKRDPPTGFYFYIDAQKKEEEVIDFLKKTMEKYHKPFHSIEVEKDLAETAILWTDAMIEYNINLGETYSNSWKNMKSFIESVSEKIRADFGDKDFDKEHYCQKIDSVTGKCTLCGYQWLVENTSQDGEFCPRCDCAHTGPCLAKNLHDPRVRPR